MGQANSAFFCGICLCIVNDAVKCNKEGANLFCKTCLAEWYKLNPTCPACKAKAKGTKRKPDAEPVVKKLIKDLDVTCRFKGHGCENVTKLGSLAEHETKCDFNYSVVVAEKISKMAGDIVNKDRMINELEANLSSAIQRLETNDKKIFKLKRSKAANSKQSDIRDQTETIKKLYIKMRALPKN